MGGDFELQPNMLRPMAEKSLSPRLTRGWRGTWTVSGRAALALILEQLKHRGVRHVQLPAYLCGSMLAPVKASGLAYSFYPVGQDMMAQPDPLPGAAVVLLHYFGWLNPATEKLRDRAGSDYFLIEDMSHCLLSNWGSLSETRSQLFFSARKWGPIPLGGWSNAVSEMEPASAAIESLAQRSIAARRLRGDYLTRPNDSPESTTETEYLNAFRAVEEVLDETLSCSALPSDVMEIIEKLDWDAVARRRRANFQTLAGLLDGHAELVTPSLNDDVVPLGLVVQLDDRDRVRAQLAEQRMYCPVHWFLPKEVDARHFPVAHRLANTCLTLPIDQRYDAQDLSRLGNALLSARGP
jgi:hypothetical protein